MRLCFHFICRVDKRREYVYNSNGWKDQLVSSTVFSSAYDPSCCQYCNSTITENFSYNSLGNPTVYRSHSLAWERVNLLKQFGSNTFTYSADGMRLSKNNIRYDYLGDRLLKETRATRVLRYYYGLDGVIGFNLRNVGSTTGTDYYFRKNLQGDVISVVSSTGDVCASYRYDAFGNCEIVTNINNIAEINPIRYRSYYYDAETNLYYLQTRYYDPEVGRFISPDSIKYLEPETINGLNLYAYSLNNPVMFSDPSGHFVISAFVGLMIAGAIIGGTAGGITARANGQDIATGILTGALLGAAVGAIIGIGGATLSGAISTTMSKAVSDLINVSFYGGKFGTWEDYAVAFIFGGISGDLGSIAGKYKKVASFLKFGADVALRPFVNQLVKITTRGGEFDKQKLKADIITRAISFKNTKNVWNNKILDLALKVDFGKCFNRVTVKFIYEFCNDLYS